MVDILPVLLLLMIFLLVVGQVVIVVYLQVLQRDFFERISRLLNLPEQERQSWGVWHRAMAKMQAILGQAELEGVKIVADSKYATKQLEGIYENQLRQASEKMEKEYRQFLTDLEKENRSEIQENNQRIFAETGKALTAFTKSLEEKLPKIGEETLDLAFQEGEKAKMDLENYKKSVIDVTQNNLVAIIDQVAKEVVGKSLSLDDQTELITEAFTRAKKEKFIT